MSKTPKHVIKTLTAKQVIAKLRSKACANAETNADGTPKKPKDANAKTEEEAKAAADQAAADQAAKDQAAKDEAARLAAEQAAKDEAAKACGTNTDGTPKKPETNADGTPKKTDESAKADPIVDVQALMDKISGLEAKIDMLSEGLAIVLETSGMCEDGAGDNTDNAQTDAAATDNSAAKDIDSMSDEEIAKELEAATAELEKIEV